MKGHSAIGARIGTVALWFLGTSCAQAPAQQAYPDKPITFVNSNAAGGVSDKITRVIARSMEKSLGKPIIVLPKPGGASVVGVAYVLRSVPDGYTVGHTCSGPIVSELMGEKLPFDVDKDMVTIGDTAASDIIIVGRPDIGVNSIEDLIAVAKKKPRQLNIGMVQSPFTVVAAAYLNKMEGIELNLVYYKGENEAATDLLGGSIQFSMNSIGLTQQYIQSGAMKGIFLLSQDRNPVLPDVPAVGDNRIKGGINAQITCLLFVPTGTPQFAVERLNAALNEAVKDPALKDIYRVDGMVVPSPKTLEQARMLIPDIRKRWSVAREVIDYTKVK